jgi:sortase A
MRDKRPVDELSIEELERILAIRRREARMQQMQRMQRDGRVVKNAHPAAAAIPSLSDPPSIAAPVLSAPTAATPAAETPQAYTVPTPSSELDEVRFEDDDGTPLNPQTRARDARRRKQLINRLLLGVEVLAVLGIVWIGLNLVGAISALERETQAAQQAADEQRRAGLPTIEPTPTIRWENIVLPTGHIYNANGTYVDFNLNEIPAHLRPVVQSQLLQPVLSRPQPTAETANRIVIPKINVDDLIVPGVDPEALRLGVGQLVNGVDPGRREGNLVLAAHNDIYGQIFRYLDQLAAGDRFTIYTQVQAHEYVVADVQVVQPNEVWVMENQSGRAMATLISCYPYQVNSQRIVVFADRVS